MTKKSDDESLARVTGRVRDAVSKNSMFWRDMISESGPNHFLIQETDGREFIITVKQTMPPEDER